MASGGSIVICIKKQRCGMAESWKYADNTGAMLK